MPLRVPILSPLNELPTGVHVLEPSLPEYLGKGKVATKDELADIDGVTQTTVEGLIATARAAMLQEVTGMIAAAVGHSSGAMFTQATPVGMADLRHDFDRDGPVSVTLYSIDYSFVWEFFEIHRLDENVVRLSFDEPIAFHAIVL